MPHANSKRYHIHGATGDSRDKNRAGLAKNRQVMRDEGVRAGERRRSRDGRTLMVLGPSDLELDNGAVEVRYDDGEEKVLYPRTVAIMPEAT